MHVAKWMPRFAFSFEKALCMGSIGNLNKDDKANIAVLFMQWDNSTPSQLFDLPQKLRLD